jgi:hypothetical protein
MAFGQYTFGTTEVTIGADSTSNYSSSWGTTNQGDGFSDWTFDTNTPNGGFAGRTLGSFSSDLDVSSESFGLFANSGNDAVSGASVDFPKKLHEGDSFEISVGVNFRDGAKGFDLRDASNNSIINFNVASDTYSLAGTTLFANSYDANTVITFTFTQNASDVSWSVERSGGLTGSQSGTISSVNSGTIENIRLYNVSAGTNGDGGSGQRNLYFNRLNFNGKHVVPNGESVTLAENKTVPYLWILSGGTFTGSDGSARTLTISSSASGNQSSFNNNGTWANGTGGSTVVFTGAPSSGNPIHQVSGTTSFQNVTVNKTSGASDVGVDFQTGVTVSGTLRIGSGGYVATAPPSSFYGSSAILDFNQGSGADYAVNTGDNSWSTTEVPNNITITSGTVTLNESRTLTGELLIQSGATLVTNGNFNLATGGVLTDNGTITGDINFLRELTGSAGFRFLSSPTASSYSDLLDAVWTQGASAGADTDQGNPNVFTWDRTTDAWQGATNLDANVVAGTGFLVYVYADDNFDGSDDAFPKTLSVSGTENAVDTAPTLNSANDGYTLVGNPFATTIDFDDATKVDLTNVAHVWDPNSSSWKTWNGTTGDITNGLITSFQGFFVQNSSSASSPSITFGSGSKSSGGTFLGKIVNANSFVRLKVEGNGLSNSAWLQLSEEGSFSNKVMGDAIELQPLSISYAQLAIQKGSELMDIAHVNANEEYSLPLAFSSTTGGEFTLEATDFSIPSNVEVTFHDYQEGVSLIINDSFSYNFETVKLKAQDVPSLSVINKMEVLKAKSVNDERFGLTITPVSTVSNEEEIASVNSFKLEQNYPNPFNPSTSIKYTVAENGPVNITVYNVMGQKVSELLNTNKAAGSYQVTWNASGVSSGIYYYRLTAPGVVLTRQMTLIK